MSNWNDDRDDRPRRGGLPWRDDNSRGDRDRSRDLYAGARDDYGQEARWGSGDYRQNYDRGSNRSRYASGSSWDDRTSGRGSDMQSDLGPGEFSGRVSGGGYAGYDYGRGPSGSGYGREDNEQGGEFGGNYGRSGGTNVYRSDYTSGESGARTRGTSANYFGGGGYGTRTDYENAPGHEYLYGRGAAYGGSSSMERQSFRGRGPKGFQRSDDRIRELVCERLHDHHDIDASDIEVTVNDGEVTLAGTVDDRRTKMLAEDVVESVSGVSDVHNALKVDRGFFSRMAEKVRDAMGDTGNKH